MKLITKNVTEKDSIEKVHAALINRMISNRQQNVKEMGVSITIQVYIYLVIFEVILLQRMNFNAILNHWVSKQSFFVLIIFFRNTIFFIFQDRKLKFSASVWKIFSWNPEKIEGSDFEWGISFKVLRPGVLHHNDTTLYSSRYLVAEACGFHMRYFLWITYNWHCTILGELWSVKCSVVLGEVIFEILDTVLTQMFMRTCMYVNEWILP